MKSMFFRNLAKGFVIAGAVMALVNCDSSTAANDNQNTTDPTAVTPTDNPANPGDPTNPVNNPVIDPETGLPVDPALNPTDPATDPAQGGVTDPTNPGTDPIVNPGDPANLGEDPNAGLTNPPLASSSSSAEGVVDPAPLSSAGEVVKPQSSSSEEAKVESSSSEAKVEGGIFLAADTDENKDYMEIEYIENIQPCINDNGKTYCRILAYPKRLSNDKKHAVVVWGPGGGSDPKSYGGIIKRLASHGFVVVALPQSPGNATQGKPALDWLESKNEDPNDPLYQKLDMTKVGCSGHSMGGLESEQMLIQDSRVITAIMNNSGDLGHTAMSTVPQGKTIAIVYGEGGMERPNAEADYHNQGVKVPACLIKMTGGKGTECQQNEYGQWECGWGHGSGPWGGMAATVAWMRWHLGGEDFRKADFVGTSGKYINGAIIGEQGNWKGQCKNF